MTTKTTVQVIPDPQGLISRKLWLQTRLIDIRQATERYTAARKVIPSAWVDEALMLKLEIEAEK